MNEEASVPAEWFTAAQREHADRLVVGARVRIVERECDNQWCKRVTGDTGKIIQMLNPLVDGWDAHDYRVWVEDHVKTGWYAAEELELVEPLDD